MRKLLILALLLPGCATSHQFCMDHISEYRDYDQCYSEHEAKRAQARYALSHMGDGLANQQTTNCTSFVNGNVVNTTCN